MENAQIADIFDNIADLLDLQDENQFRIRSYRNAARTVRDLPQRIEDLIEQGEDLSELPNVGKGTAEKIHEIIETGTCKRYEDAKEAIPQEVTRLMDIPQVGARKAMQFYKELNVKSLDDLKKACKQHKVRDLEGMGAKTEENILKGIEQIKSTSQRVRLNTASQYVQAVSKLLEGIDGIERWEVAGSYRRGKETVGDLDFIIQAKDRKHVGEEIKEFREVEEIIGHGEEKLSVRLGNALQVDFRFFENENFGAALHYFTGSKAHNIHVRQIAQDRDWKLNEYGLFKDDRRLAGKTEESIFHRLDLVWIPPEMREDRGEIQAAQEDNLPDLIEMDQIHGDLHCHTNETDGYDTLETMVEAAQERGYEYMAITEHSKAVSVARGLDEKRLEKHAKKIRKLNDSLDGFWLMTGIEVDIMKNGDLDLDTKALKELDWVVASVHSYFDLDKKHMTDRLLKAIDSGVVHCLGHPFGRQIGQRKMIEFDVDRVFQACRDRGVFLEINAHPSRLDVPDDYCKYGKDQGVDFAICTDAHRTSDLDFIRFGVGVARRGWLEKKNILNTNTLRSLRKRLGDKES